MVPLTHLGSPLPMLIAGTPLHVKYSVQKAPNMVLKRFGIFVGILSLVWVFVQIGYGLLMR